MKLTKKDFSCWGNGDKYDDELFIEHDPKITAVELADEILKNQEKAEKWDSYDWAGNNLLTNQLIVERLKKRIEGLKRSGSDWGTDAPVLIKELQKILEGKK